MTVVNYNAGDPVPPELQPYLAGDRPGEDGEWYMYCPLHDDNNRSASLNTVDGVWYCHAGCGGGTIKDLLGRQDDWIQRSAAAQASMSVVSNNGAEELSEAAVQQWHKALMDDNRRLDEIQNLRGLWQQTLVEYQIGWDAVRQAYTIPVRDERNELVNIRRYQPHPPKDRRKMWSVNGHGSPVLFPLRSLTRDAVIICEGELDALVTSQYGFPTITRTASAGTWKDSWNKLFKDKLVFVCHDRDRAGIAANQLVARKLSGVAREVRTIHLPYKIAEKHGRDLTDWWLEHDGQVDDFRALVRQAKRGQVVKLKVKSGQAKPPAKKDQGKLDPFELTDEANAKKFAQRSHGKLITTQVGWYRWSRLNYYDKKKPRVIWRRRPDRQIVKDAIATALSLREWAHGFEDHEDEIAALKFAKRSLARTSLESMVKLAEAGHPHVKDLVVSIDRLDRNKDVINTPNGIVDLRTGEVRPHDPAEFCTMITNVNYNPKADRTRWESFLNRIIPDGELLQALQTSLGASLTGRQTRAVFVLYGPEGENGKTQLLEAVSGVLGGYADTAAESTFTGANARDAAHDLARFRGTRFLSFSETREGHGLASERIKRVTGDELITARFLFKDHFTYRPQFSLWVSTNFTPYIPAADSAMWKRVWIWPMDQVIPKSEQIPDYGRLLAQEDGEAILSWMVDGAMAFYMDGARLKKQPNVMTEMVDRWRWRDDVLGRWARDRLEPTHASFHLTFVQLWRDFEIWCSQQGEDQVFRSYTSHKFHEEMDRRLPYERVFIRNMVAARTGLKFQQQGES